MTTPFIKIIVSFKDLKSKELFYNFNGGIPRIFHDFFPEHISSFGPEDAISVQSVIKLVRKG